MKFELQSIGEFIALAGAGSLAASFIFDYGYYIRIDPRMFQTLTIQDHISHALGAFPPIIVSLLIGMTFIPKFRIDPSLPANEIEAKFATHRRRVRWISIPTFVCALVGAFFSEFGLHALAVVIAMDVWAFVFRIWRRRFPEYGINFAVLLVGLLSILAFAIGGATAMSDLSRSTGDYTIVSVSGEPKEGVVILASTENGLYLRDPGTDLNWLLAWAEVKEVRRTIEPVQPMWGFACRWTSLCQSAPANVN